MTDEPDPLYDRAFSASERMSYQDRKRCIRQTRPVDLPGMETRAWWDGYECRSQAWGARHPGGEQ